MNEQKNAVGQEEWLEVTTLDALPPGERAFIELFDATRVLVANIEGNLYAIESMCSHAMFEMDDAEIEGEEIICPLHGAHFCMKTGKVLSAPAFEDIVVFPVKVENGKVYILDNRE